MAMGYWPDDYVAKLVTAEQALGRIKSGQRVFIGSSCGEPQHLVKELAEQSCRLTDLEITRLLSLESAPLTLIAHRSQCHNLNVRSFYLGSCLPRSLAADSRFFTPIHLSALPRLFASRRIHLHAALIQVSPPDDFGWMSLGVSVDVTQAAAAAADLVIAQVNPRMPRVLGRSFIHVNDVDLFVEHEEPLITVEAFPDMPAADQIARHTANLVDDGSTLQISLGATPRAILLALAEKNDLGVHSQFLTDGFMHLAAKGVITNRKKGLNEGKMVASAAIGSENLYEFLHDNPGIDFMPSDYVNNPGIIAQHHRMVSVQLAESIDLTGQATADALAYNNYSGVTGMVDFLRGAAQSPEGKAILMLPSTTADGRKSRIVPVVEGAVVVCRGDLHYVVTEFGAANLFGKTLGERALAMISIAHPDFREELFYEAKEAGLLGPERTLSDSLYGVYPSALEKTLEVDGGKILLRPIKPTDERLVQDHFYNLDKKDVVARFLHEKASFSRMELGGVWEVDYSQDFAVVAVVGELGFEEVVGIGGYITDPAKNLAEVSFSISRGWQKKGLGKALMNTLAERAREGGLYGFYAHTAPSNRAMIRLFLSLTYKVRTTFDGDTLVLSCRFSEPAPEKTAEEHPA
ncbi:MAG: GNAT family N-acetyltransferase [Proteobacteria bacterium]|nr:GNAT family N-acetyltransferase [Pseudomonadota bacterium]